MRKKEYKEDRYRKGKDEENKDKMIE